MSPYAEMTLSDTYHSVQCKQYATRGIEGIDQHNLRGASENLLVDLG